MRACLTIRLGAQRWSLATHGTAQLRQWWQQVIVDGDTIVAILDNVIESPGWELSIVASIDGGRTWTQRSQIRKPYYFALSRSLVMEDGAEQYRSTSTTTTAQTSLQVATGTRLTMVGAAGKGQRASLSTCGYSTG